MSARKMQQPPGVPGPTRLRRVHKPARVRPLGAVGVEDLRSWVARLSERVWAQEDAAKENGFPCFHHTRHVIFRFIAGNRDPRRFYSRPGWAVWGRMLLPVMARAAAPYGFADPVYPKVMLARLAAGHRIDRHVDGEGSHPLTHKVHVPLETNPAAVLHVDGADFHLAAGQAFEINNLVPHGAFNGGASDRIHLIFEIFEGAAAA
ncbi:MAG: aspartyl/asparaginyl beta-hydroxylase domain-containing protein [Acidobacteria bacterium]|nr:aspartyl/asparaginyl beta-hydroxylase domain-containing protein [Acidobacteriota bacterium]